MPRLGSSRCSLPPTTYTSSETERSVRCSGESLAVTCISQQWGGRPVGGRHVWCVAKPRRTRCCLPVEHSTLNALGAHARCTGQVLRGLRPRQQARHVLVGGAQLPGHPPPLPGSQPGACTFVYMYLRASHHHILSCRRFLCTVWLFYGVCHTCLAGYFAAVLHTRASCLVVRLSRKFSSIGQESQSAPLAIFCSSAALAAFSPFAQSAASR